MAFNNKIAPRGEDLSDWYLSVVEQAQLADYGPVKGTMIIRPYAYALWENIQEFLNREFKAHGSKNSYFPLFIPESFLKKEWIDKLNSQNFVWNHFAEKWDNAF